MRVNCLLKIDKARATGNTRVSSVMREREINNHKGELFLVVVARVASKHISAVTGLSALTCSLRPAAFTASAHTSAYVSIRQHTSSHVSTRQHTSAYVSVSARSSASVSACQRVSIRQHTSAYVSIRQHA